MTDGCSLACPECGDPYIGGPGCYAGACAAEPEDDGGGRPVTTPIDPADINEHGPAAVRAEIGPANRWEERHLTRAAMRHCEGCAAWFRRRDRIRRIHAAYRRRFRRG